MWCEIIKQILADMRQPLQYVPWALVIVVLGLVVTIVLSEKKGWEKSIRPVFSYTFCDLYTCGDTDYFFFPENPVPEMGA